MRSTAAAPLRFPSFRFLAAGRTVASLGNAMAPVALAFAVLDLTHSLAALGLVVGARSLTNVLFIVFGGVLADRFRRQWLMVWSCVLAAITQTIVATLVITENATVPLLIALSALNGMASAISLPASVALITQTVPQDLLQSANALTRLGINISLIAGASVGGLIVAVLGPGIALAVDAVTFLVCALLFARIRTLATVRASAPGASILGDLRHGWVEFSSRRWIWSVVLGFASINAATIGVVQILGPAIADETVGRSGWGMVLAAQMIGMAAGSIAALRLRFLHFLRYGLLCMLCTIAPPLMLILAPHIATLALAFFIGGFALEQFQVAWDTSLQHHVPPNHIARVTSYDALGSYIAIPVGEVAAGPLAENLGTSATIFGAIVIVLVAVPAMLSVRSVWMLSIPSPSTSRYDLPSADGSDRVH